ncbi:circularly permuted type 2 ATP-grasp protein [Paenibacillus antri]|uniref:Circularly permuted type 2 ATP-grasp protein n=1 Tax=Paenibacillus antri TaxID=2582848 RepID=A0A5R9G5F7_9BACL|nr:circularly permuted type 2 ATP-grasp protein [Paenibacillus antri]TLS50279.1 circularly permuted type 2 ATP-grasp protein [Paenibacillus antri]
MNLSQSQSGLPFAAATAAYYDEMHDAGGRVRPHYEEVCRTFERMTPEIVARRQAAMNDRMLEEGITYTLYDPGQADPLERTIPFDLIPRIIPNAEWRELERGLVQRTKALNCFLADVYHEQHILHDGIIPRKLIVANRYFRPEMMRLQVPNGIYTTCAGIDLIRDEQGNYFVLEDNLRSPSGYSYLFTSRSIMKRLFRELYFSHPIEEVDHSLNHFLAALKRMSPSDRANPTIALLTPGSYNSAYFEHTYLAQQMGIELVEGRDLVCMDHKIYMRTRSGLRRIDVIYRRIDDDFLDPLAFRPDSLLGVAGVMNAYRAGNVAIANAPGTGVADDKAIYTFVPDMIKYYLNEEPILSNVPTYLLSRPDEREFVLSRLGEMVVKETSLSGGYGMLIGPTATDEEIASFAVKIRENPSNYIAQPTIKLSTAPIYRDGGFVPRHIDLRAFVLSGRETHVIPGGLTRVAMKEGSLVVNSSQGGGVKDTWVLGT